jgi:hypothetical protein
MKKRDIRIHHRMRLQSKRSKYHWGMRLTTAEQKGKVVNTPTPCSCAMCGNPRKWFRQKTIQERKFELNERDE